MIYQPRNVQPSATSIDATVNNTFSMEIQTNTYITGYKLSIIDFNNNSVYAGSDVTLETYLYNGDTLSIPVSASTSGLVNGTNYKWRVRLYQSTSDMLVTYNNVVSTSTTTSIYVQSNINIKVGMYLKIGTESNLISAYDNSTGLVTVSTPFTSAPTIGTAYYIYSNFIDTVPDYIVYARQTPSVSISNVPNTLTLKYHTFQGVYTQSNNVPIVYHIFNLYILDSGGNKSLVDTSDKVYSANLQYTYNSFRTDNTYYIEMIIENEMGIVSTTTLYSFCVSYSIIQYLQQPTATFSSDNNAINIAWVAPVEHYGSSNSTTTSQIVNENYLYNTPYNEVNSLYTNGYETTWETSIGLCEMPEDYNITLQFCPDDNFFYDSDGHYQESAVLVSGETDDASNEGDFEISIDKNKLTFSQEPSLELESYFFPNANQTFVLTQTGIKQISNDYVWLDSGTWNDNYYWTEGGTSLERVVNHWWKVQITSSEIKMEEIFPSS